MLAVLVLIFSISANAEHYGFSIPSYVSVRGGFTEIESYSAGISAGFTLANNKILGVSFETMTLPNTVDPGTLSMNNATVSLSTDPLQDWSFQGSVDGWTSEDAVSAYGARGAATWTGSRWMWTFEYGLQLITFNELPVFLWSDKKSTVSENSVLIAGDVQLSRNFSLRASHRMHWYNTPMEDYAQGLRTRFIAAEVLNMAGTLTKEDTDLGLTYYRRKWHWGLDLTSNVSSLDELRTNGLGLRIGYRLQKKWSFEVQGARYESENSVSSNPLHSFNSTATYSW
jgi:hypothetical protein